ncbi:TetR/AcrR family transcriptional regulator [Actinomadura verrucosospora]|uniref:TetR family transcriptional regulator n=1 Tax=Actinomadura verrucosospora TaxID=46165 RepID=A0A7D3VUF6_ACTVE|nr:TetR/AcrR family transcriptional regulator [Actinomadura verrucosospora]QKG23173.1 TetR family transcriptional regulator [Actinomadura verrucosospora]
MSEGEGTARRGRLTRDRIVAAAARIVGREGSAALSMRKVADELGSAPMSIYRHVRDKDELLVLVLDRIVAELPRPDLPDAPRERLLALLTWEHDELAKRPWIAGVLAGGDLMAPAIVWLLEEIYAAWRACGLTLAQAASANRIVWGFLLSDLLRRADAPPGRPPYQDAVPATADPAVHPNLAALAGYWTAPGRRDHFAADLSSLVDALIATPPAGV